MILVYFVLFWFILFVLFCFILFCFVFIIFLFCIDFSLSFLSLPPSPRYHQKEKLPSLLFKIMVYHYYGIVVVVVVVLLLLLLTLFVFRIKKGWFSQINWLNFKNRWIFIQI